MPGSELCFRAWARAQLAIRRVAALVGGGRDGGTACARQVRWVQADSIQAQLDSRNIVLLSNIGDALPRLLSWGGCCLGASPGRGRPAAVRAGYDSMQGAWQERRSNSCREM